MGSPTRCSCPHNKTLGSIKSPTGHCLTHQQNHPPPPHARSPSAPGRRRSTQQLPWVRSTGRWLAPGRFGARRPRWRSRTRRSSRAAAPTSASSTTAASSPPSSASARSAAPTRRRSRSRPAPWQASFLIDPLFFVL